MADCRRDVVPPLLTDYTGPARIETYTVFYALDGDVRDGVVIAQTPGGARVLATVPGDDRQVIDALIGSVEAVGTFGAVTATLGQTTRWKNR